ncbi:hypothetical protein BCR44DRAFT_1444992 [Catenaria anguillulae PL171]|uniref:Uncharacterized protein n=1 Tax=Catenaria anguillulae PL171 TaxID=765915 RepID=A0A1Y2H777_9FUNG|nr:hypothetical protein BCR44DRAFT_1444992 [Catenaria anguillulae PL171]
MMIWCEEKGRWAKTWARNWARKDVGKRRYAGWEWEQDQQVPTSRWHARAVACVTNWLAAKMKKQPAQTRLAKWVKDSKWRVQYARCKQGEYAINRRYNTVAKLERFRDSRLASPWQPTIGAKTNVQLPRRFLYLCPWARCRRPCTRATCLGQWISLADLQLSLDRHGSHPDGNLGAGRGQTGRAGSRQCFPVQSTAARCMSAAVLVALHGISAQWPVELGEMQTSTKWLRQFRQGRPIHQCKQE